MRYPYGHPDNWETTDSGKQIIYTTDPADILEFDRPRVIYELRKAIEDKPVYVEASGAKWCIRHDAAWPRPATTIWCEGHPTRWGVDHEDYGPCISVPLYIEARDP